VARYRLSEPAEADIAAILKRSDKVHGKEARIRYRACLSAAMRRVTADPMGRLTVDRADLVLGFRSFHIRHSRTESRETPVANPVHVIFYRIAQPGIVEIVRVLHDRTEPGRHIGADQNLER
jgi:toxin ParE1/3/4